MCSLTYFRNVLQKAYDMRLETLALCVINSVYYNYPPDEGAHIALRKYDRIVRLKLKNFTVRFWS